MFERLLRLLESLTVLLRQFDLDVAVLETFEIDDVLGVFTPLLKRF